MVVANVFEVVDLILGKEKGRSNRMDWGVAPSLVEKAPSFVQVVEKFSVCLRTPEFQRGHLEVGPEVAQIIRFPLVVGNEVHEVVFGQVLGVFLDEVLDVAPQRRNRLFKLVDRNRQSLHLVIVLHVFVKFVVQVAVYLDARLDSPIPIVLV